MWGSLLSYYLPIHFKAPDPKLQRHLTFYKSHLPVYCIPKTPDLPDYDPIDLKFEWHLGLMLRKHLDPYIVVCEKIW